MADIYEQFSKNLYKIGVSVYQTDTLSDVTSVSAISDPSISPVVDPGGATSVPTTTTTEMVQGLLQSGNFLTGVRGWIIKANGDVEFGSGYFRGDITGATGTFSGTVNVGSLNIPNATTVNSFHIDTTGNVWWGTNVGTGYATAPTSILNTGVVKFSSGTIGGTTITATKLYGGIIQTSATVGAGSDGVIMDSAGIRMYDDILGLVVNIPSNGSRPKFSSGDITLTNFKVETALAIRTADTVGDGSVDSAGILINDTGLYACEDNQLLVDANVKILVDGSAVYKGIVEIGTPAGARVNISGNDIILYDDSTGGTIPVTGNTASINFTRTDDSTQKFIIQKRAGKNDDDENIMEFFYDKNSNNGESNYLFIGRKGDSNDINNHTDIIDFHAVQDVRAEITCVNNYNQRPTFYTSDYSKIDPTKEGVVSWLAGEGKDGFCAIGSLVEQLTFSGFIMGSSTTQFDITEPVADTIRYTWDSTGTDPLITIHTIAIGSTMVINAQNFNANNNGTFIVTGSGKNYFEITNASGVTESNKTIGTGSILSNNSTFMVGDIITGNTTGATASIKYNLGLGVHLVNHISYGVEFNTTTDNACTTDGGGGGTGTGNLDIATYGTIPILYTDRDLNAKLGNHLIPDADNQMDIGTQSLKIRNIFGGGHAKTFIASQNLTAGRRVGVSGAKPGYVAQAVTMSASAAHGITTPLVAADSANNKNACAIGGDAFVYLNYTAASSGSLFVQTGMIDRDTMGVTVGTVKEVAVSFTPAPNLRNVAICKLDTNKFIVFYVLDSSTTVIKYRVGTVDLPSGTITLGGEASFVANTVSSVAGNQAYMGADYLSTDKGVMFYKAGTETDSKIIVFTVSGTTATSGTSKAMGTNVDNLKPTYIKKIATDKFILACVSDVNKVYAQAGTCTGTTTITTGSEVWVYSGTCDPSYETHLQIVSPQDNVFVMSVNYSQYSVALIPSSVSGTTINADIPLEATAGLNDIGCGGLYAYSSTTLYVTGAKTTKRIISRFTLSGASGTTLTDNGIIVQDYASLYYDIYAPEPIYTIAIDNGYFVIADIINGYTQENVKVWIQGMSNNFIGVNTAEVMRGDTVTVQVDGIFTYGGGLIEGATYTVYNGGLVFTPMNTVIDTVEKQFLVKALSSTDLLIK